MNNKIQENIQLVINTLQSIDIKADYDTMNKLLGCLQMLSALKKDAEYWVVEKVETDSETESSEEPQ